MKRTEYVEVHLPYWKQGDDLNNFIEGNNAAEAFQQHADLMDDVADMLYEIASILRVYNQEDISIEADTHHISISAPEEVCKRLVDEQLASYLDEDMWEESFCESDD